MLNRSLAFGFTVSTALLFALIPTAASAQGAASYPTKPIRVLIGSGAGSPPDVLGRIVLQKMSEGLGQQLIVENRLGAASTLATAQAAAAVPDGYTITVASTMSHGIGPALFPKAGYDPEKSFTAISLIGSAPFFLTVNAAVPAKDPREFFALVRARPGQLNYGSAGPGSPPQIVMEMFRKATGLDLTHVSYKGNHYPALLAGEIQATFDVPTLFAPHERAGKVRALAIAGPQRHPLYPNTPTMAEAGVPGFEASAWYGLVAPRDTAPEIVARLNAETRRALNAQEVRDAFARLVTDPVASSPEQFATFIASEAHKWGKAVRDSGVKIE